jgi:hypothetical protein
MGVELVWEEPPAEAIRGGNSEVTRIVEALKKNPGKWARVEEGVAAKSAVTKWERRGCEAVARNTGARKNGKGYTYNVYARWAAEPAEPPAPPKKPTQQDLAKAYAQKHGAPLAPGREKLTAPADEEPDVTRTAEETPPAVTQAWKTRLGHARTNR